MVGKKIKEIEGKNKLMKDLIEEFKTKAEPLLQKIAKKRNSVVFPLLFHIQTSINPWCISKIYNRLQKIPKEKMKKIERFDVIIFSRGGDPDTAFHIGKMLHNFVGNKRLTFVIPRAANSAATLITFAGDEILMNLPSELGPIDPQIEVMPGRFVSVRSLRESFELIFERIVRCSDISKVVVEAVVERLPLHELVDYERLLEHIEELAVELLKFRMIKNEEKAKNIAETFVKKFKHHGRSITYDDCIRLGLNVKRMKGDEWNVIWEFHNLWEELANIEGKIGSEVLPIELGDGIMFVPSQKAEEEKGKSSVEEVITHLVSKE